MTKSGWTLEWEFRNYKGESIGKRYPLEYWNGGFMKWDTIPNKEYVFNSEFKAKEFARKFMWDKKDPSNKTYKIVPYSGKVTDSWGGM